MTPPLQKGFCLQEALDMLASLSDSEDVTDIYIAPPEPSVLTDEDSADEDDGGLVDNLSGRQLSAPAEIKLSNNKRINSEIIAQDIENRPSTASGTRLYKNSSKDQKGAERKPIKIKQIQKKRKTKRHIQKKKTGSKITWIEGDFDPPPSFNSSPDFSRFAGKSPTEMFELFCNSNVVHLLIEESNRYAHNLNCPDHNLTSDEVKCFIAILFLTGYNRLPGKKYYWEKCPDVHNLFVSGAMRRDRFIQIMRFIHCADNSQPDLTDRMWKLRPLLEIIKKNCAENFVPCDEFSYDESMIKYFGKHGCKQFIRGKPIRFGYKVWCLNSSYGYLLNFRIYQGKNHLQNTSYDKLFGTCASPLVSMMDELPVKNRPYHFFIDNLFTGFNLLKHVKQCGYGATGTMRENRLSPHDCPLPSKKAMEKRQRGSHESKISKDDGIIVVRWVDNAVVTVASTCFGVNPSSNVRRYSQSEKKHIIVPRPFLIGKYNKGMGGTDRMDQDIAQYRISIRGKKWWWSLFTWQLEVCMHNAWVLYKQIGNKVTKLEFRRQVVMDYINKFGVEPRSGGRPSSSKIVPRYDRTDHLIERVVGNKRRRCVGDGCSSVGRTMCSKCDVGLCIDCFIGYHTK